MIILNGETIELKKFRSGELDVTLPSFVFDDRKSPFEDDMHNWNRITWYYENDAELFALYCIARALPTGVHTLNIPYLPNARMDRVDPVDHNVFTLKYFAEIINMIHADIVNVFDVHSQTALALIDNVNNVSAESSIRKAFYKIPSFPVVLFPDNGAAKRYQNIFRDEEFSEDDKRFLPVNIIKGMKDRTWKDGKITSFKIDKPTDFSVDGRDALIIDDISSSGETFRLAAEALKEIGIRDIYLYASHVEEATLKNEQLMKTIKKIYTPTRFHVPVDPEHIVLLESKFCDLGE